MSTNASIPVAPAQAEPRQPYVAPQLESLQGWVLVNGATLLVSPDALDLIGDGQ